MEWIGTKWTWLKWSGSDFIGLFEYKFIFCHRKKLGLTHSHTIKIYSSKLADVQADRSFHLGVILYDTKNVNRALYHKRQTYVYCSFPLPFQSIPCFTRFYWNFLIFKHECFAYSALSFVCIIENRNCWRSFLHYRDSLMYIESFHKRPDLFFLMLGFETFLVLPVHPGKTQISLGINPVWWVFTVRLKKEWVLNYPLSA